MTEDEMPTPIAAARRSGSRKAGTASPMPIGRAAIIAMSMATPRRSMPCEPPAPHGKNDRRAGDAQPGDAERGNLGEQEDCEGRAEIVKHRADDEEELRRNALGERNAGGVGEGSGRHR